MIKFLLWAYIVIAACAVFVLALPVIWLVLTLTIAWQLCKSIGHAIYVIRR